MFKKCCCQKVDGFFADFVKAHLGAKYHTLIEENIENQFPNFKDLKSPFKSDK